MLDDPGSRCERLYADIWAADPSYGTAPSDVEDTVLHRIAPHIRRLADPVHRCVDFGAGDGRFLRAMLRHRLITSGIGIDVHQPPDLPAEIGWRRQLLWEPADVEAEYVISTDALEHVPANLVRDVLIEVNVAAPHGFLRIATREDRYGTNRGLRLHETVAPADWWVRACRAAGIPVVDYKVYSDRAVEVWW